MNVARSLASVPHLVSDHVRPTAVPNVERKWWNRRFTRLAAASTRRRVIGAPQNSSSRVVQVLAWPLCRVDVWRWNELGSSVGGESHLPVAVVDQAMMVSAERNGVVQIR